MTIGTAILADNPLHYWRLADPPGSDVAADIGSTRIPAFGQIKNGGCGYTGPSSDGGSAFQNNQLGWYTTHVAIPQQIPGSFELWFWNGGGGTNRNSFSWDGAITSSTDMFVDTTNKVQARYGAGGFGNLAQGVASSLQVWHQFVITADAANQILYVDGALVAQQNVVPLAGSGQVTLGGDTAHTVGFFGFVSEVAIFSTKLSAARVQAHYLAADQLNTLPIWTGTSWSAGSSGGGAVAGAPALAAALVDLADVLAAVRRAV